MAERLKEKLQSFEGRLQPFLELQPQAAAAPGEAAEKAADSSKPKQVSPFPKPENHEKAWDTLVEGHKRFFEGDSENYLTSVLMETSAEYRDKLDGTRPAASNCGARLKKTLTLDTTWWAFRREAVSVRNCSYV
jgi:transcription initiation factor TFIID subunit TAF12